MPVIPSTKHSPSFPNPEDQPSNGHGPDSEQDFPPTLLEIRDLSSLGAKRFLQSIDPCTILTDAISTVFRLLNLHQESHPNVRSITLILRDFDGVAYTAGKDIDFEHKEIHFSTAYIESIAPERIKDEITGVLVHEMVHVWQWNGKQRCNGGLIEGIADWVRLEAGLAPPHWTQRCEGCEWDSGYEITGYFLDWLEERVRKGIVVKMNQNLREEYIEEEFWNELLDGETIKTLWAKYAESWEGDRRNKDLQPKGKPAKFAKELEASEDEKNNIPNGMV
ncbi:MAG: hypothetical protein Q9213_006213 [Squamulea squamosa]